MDFRNLCQKMNMDGVIAKLPTMPQLQFPKALPKLKSRKIFRSSNNDISEREKNSSPRSQAFAQQQQQSSLAPPIPPATFINHTPTRISTISSLIHEQGDQNQGVSAAGNTYCSAFSVDDDYPSPRQRQCEAGTSAAPNLLSSSPIRTNAVDAGGTENRNVHMSITEKLQKGYKDISEFRMKYIFAKKTVVRKDEIQVKDYVLQYDEERRREQLEEERHDKKIADNYNIKFTLSNSRQNTVESDDVASTPMKRTTERQAPMPPIKQPTTTVRSGKREQSSDESDMERTPQAYKPGIAATRFSRVRSPPLKMDSMDDEKSSPPTCNLTTSKSSGLNEAATTKSSSKLSGNPHMRRLMSYLSLQEEPSKTGAEKNCYEKASSPTTLKKKTLGGSTVTFEQETTANTENRPLEAIKQNVKLFQKFIKNMRTETASNTDTGYEEGSGAVIDVPERKVTHRDGRWSQIRRFKSTQDVASKPKDSIGLGRKLKTWKKSFKNNTAEPDRSCDEGSPDKKPQEKRSDKLIKKLKNMGSRMSTTSKSEPEDEWVGTETSQDLKPTQKKAHHMASKIDENFIQDREESMKKVTYTNRNESRSDSDDDEQESLPPSKTQIRANQRNKHQNMAELNKDKVQQEYIDSSSEDEEQNSVQFSDNSKIPPAINARRRCFNSDYEYYTEQDQIEQINTIQSDYAKRHSELYGASTLTAWTTKPILCQESMDSDDETEFPRVLIHQDHSDAFESTLIIAVTRPASTTLSPQIDEIISGKHMLKSPSVCPKPLTDAEEWLPNEQIISSFLASNINSNQDAFVRDASLPKSIRCSPENNNHSEQNINQVKDDPWLTQTESPQVQKLKKTKTIDIFETNLRNGGARTAFEDFDDELRYEPVVKIEHDRSEMYDTTEDDNSSRLSNTSMQTVNENKTLVATNIFNNNQSSSRESLVAHISEDCSGSTDEGNYDEDDECFDSDCPPTTAPPKPPSSSSSPVAKLQMPLNESASKASTAGTVDLTAEECEDIPMPPLRISKPPLPGHQIPMSKPPELPSSMTRLARPLVKTASLRLAYNEQIKPDDIGKVNKLISRFETPGKKCRERPRIISRRMQSQDSEECSDYEIEKNNNAVPVEFDIYDQKVDLKFTQVTETTPVVKSSSMPATLIATENVNSTRRHTQTATIPEIITTRDNSNDDNYVNRETTHSKSTVEQHCSDNNKSALGLDRKNSNCSRSEYGSPLAYSLSWRRSYETTPVPERKQQQMELLQQHQRHTRYKRRSMTKDDDNFYSFDSDEENSYYSISPSDSSRYVVEI